MRAFVIRFLGTISGLISALPMPWKVRMWMASAQGRIMRWILDHVPGVYEFVIAQNVKYGMGKQEQGEMQSIWALNRIVRQIENKAIPLSQVQQAIRVAEAQRISQVEFPRFLGHHLLGATETDRILSKFVDY